MCVSTLQCLMSVRNSKPPKESRLFERKIEDAISQARKTVQIAQDRIRKSKAVNQASRDIIDTIRRNRKREA